MDDDFLLPEGETPSSPRRNLLLTIVALLAALILFSLCAIGLLVVEKRQELLASFAAQPALPSGTPTIRGTSTLPSSSPSAAAQTDNIIAQQTVTVEIPRGEHRIINYGERRIPFRVISTATPQSPHRIIRYYTSISGEDKE